MFHHKFLFVIFVILLAAPFYVHANSDSTELINITVEQAIEKALNNNFELAALKLESKKAKARTFQESRLPNPELSIEMENFGGSGELRQSDSVETTVMIIQPLLLGGKRTKQEKVNILEEELSKWDLQSLRLNIINEVHKAFIDVIGAQEFIKLNRELVTLEEEVLQLVKDRVKAGKVSPIEEIKAKTNLDVERLILKRAERSLFAASIRLSAMWGDSTLSFNAVSEDIAILQELPDFSTLTTNINQNPDLARWSVELEKRKASLALEKSRRIPDVELGVGWRDFNESDEHAYLAGITIPLPLFNRNKGAIREAVYDISKTEKDKASSELSLQTELWIVYNETKLVYSEASALRNSVVPGMEKVMRRQQEGFRMGKFDYLEVLDAQRSFFESRRNLLDALIGYHKGIADIGRLTGSEKLHANFVKN